MESPTRSTSPTSPTPPTSLDSPRPPVALSALTLGFAAAVGMWVVGYLAHFPGSQAPVWATAAGMSIVQIAAGVLGRWWGVHLSGAAIGGLIASLVNLLIVGSVIASVDSGLRDGWPLMVSGALIFGPVASAIGWLASGPLGHEPRPIPATAADWVGRFAVIAAVSAVPVLASGGIVTTFDAGLAVNNWPGTYDAQVMFLFPLQDMTGGIYYEHAHRLFGSLTGLTTLVLMVMVLRHEPRRWVKAAVIGAFLLVCLQGVLGGVGVSLATDNPDAIAHAATAAEVPSDFAAATDTSATKLMRLVHGILGQVTFAFLCIVAAFVSRTWRAGIPTARTPRASRPADRILRAMATATAHTLVLQLIAGAILRHYENPKGSLHAHMTLAVLIAVMATIAASRAMGGPAATPVLKRLGRAVMASVFVQIGLGFAAMTLVMRTYGGDPTRVSLAISTLHHLNGAFLLAMAWLIEVWARRQVAKRPDHSAGVSDATGV